MQALIKYDYKHNLIEQRASDGYINATAMCKATGKLIADYLTNKSTKAYLEALSDDMGIPISTLVQIIKGGNKDLQGTWVHPDVANNLAQWASPHFAVWVSKLVTAWLSGKHKSLPIHLDRYLRNDDNIPNGYFSTLQIAATHLIGKLHIKGFDVPSNWVPDISIGLTFCKYLKSKGIDTNNFKTYEHDYYDGRPTYPAKLYPNVYLPLFLTWFSNVWIPNYGVDYFKRKDKEFGLNSMSTVIQLSEFKLLKNDNKPLLG